MKLKITVHGVAYEVEVEVLDADDGFPAAPLPRTSPTASHPAPTGAPVQACPPTAAPRLDQGTSPDGSITSPIAGNVVEVKVAAGDAVTAGQVIIIVEAMKMNTSIAAPGAGIVKKVLVAPGDAIRESQPLVQIG